MPLRVAAISFLNPAPLLYGFEHEPQATELRRRYDVHYTTPARCAAELHTGEADLGLIPVAELTPELLVVPGCTIASLHEVRSILLLVGRQHGEEADQALQTVRTVAVDSASRSSTAYLRTILRHFYHAAPAFVEQHANPLAMLQQHDAALLIGDPALVAREQQAEVEDAFRRQTGHGLHWIDLAALWHRHTGLPWVAAVWAVREAALDANGFVARQLHTDLLQSRDLGISHTEQIVSEWVDRLPVSADTIRRYLTQNIYYFLEFPCMQAIERFRALAAEAGVLPPLPSLPLLKV